LDVKLMLARGLACSKVNDYVGTLVEPE
jgi:hypothetical protein